MDQQKIWLIGGAAVVGLVVISKLAGKESSDTQQTPVISNIGPSGTDVNERFAIQAQSSLANQQSKLAGLGALLDYSTAQKGLDTQYALGIADLTNSTAIKNKELDTSLMINSQNVESQNLQARLASQTAMSIAAQEAATQIAAIGAQVQVASIAAGVESERTKADVTLGMRGYDSADYATASNEKLGLAAIDLQKFGITQGVDLSKYELDTNYAIRRKELKTDKALARIGADRDVTISGQQTQAQIQMAKINRPKWYESLFSALGDIIPSFAP